MARVKSWSSRAIGETWAQLGNTVGTKNPYNYNSSYGSSTLYVSQNHSGPPYKQGGTFLCVHETVDRVPRQHYGIKGLYRAKGVHICEPPNYGYPLPVDMSTTLFGLGSKGYSLGRPDRPVADIAQMIGEFKDYLSLKPLIREGSNPLRNAAKDFIGYEFGARPLINDIRSLMNIQSNLEKKYAFLVNNNGRRIRRSIDLGTSDETYSSNSTGVWVVPTTLVGSSYPRFIRHTSTKKFWYSGAFKFWVPELKLPNGRWPSALLAAQIGGSVDAKLLYELTPWSWLIDWFSTFGDALGNLSNFGIDHLVQEYGYVMGSHSVISKAEDLVPLYDHNGVLRTVTFTPTRSTVLKQRAVGHPYGFGANPQPLSLRQGAILAALGLSKL